MENAIQWSVPGSIEPQYVDMTEVNNVDDLISILGHTAASCDPDSLIITDSSGLCTPFITDGKLNWEGFNECRDFNEVDDAKLAFLTIHHGFWSSSQFSSEYKGCATWNCGKADFMKAYLRDMDNAEILPFEKYIDWDKVCNNLGDFGLYEESGFFFSI